MRVIGEVPPGAEMHSSKQLHASGEDRVWLRVSVDPVHQGYGIGIIEFLNADDNRQ